MPLYHCRNQLTKWMIIIIILKIAPTSLFPKHTDTRPEVQGGLKMRTSHAQPITSSVRRDLAVHLSMSCTNLLRVHFCFHNGEHRLLGCTSLKLHWFWCKWGMPPNQPRMDYFHWTTAHKRGVHLAKSNSVYAKSSKIPNQRNFQLCAELDSALCSAWK